MLLKTIRKVRGRCYKTAKTLGDVQAVLQGRLADRLVQRQAGKMSRKTLNKLRLKK